MRRTRVGGELGGVPGVAPPGPVTLPVTTMIPRTPDVQRGFRPLPAPWSSLEPSSVVLPWHVGVLGEPKHARVGWLPVVAPEPFPGAGPCEAYAAGGGEGDVLYANDAPTVETASTLFVGEHALPGADVTVAPLLGPARALPNGWLERSGLRDAGVSLFTRPSGPWVCAKGARVRDRLRAALVADARLPILVGLPRELVLVSFFGAGAGVPASAQWTVTSLQLDRDARRQAEETSCTRQLPRHYRIFVQSRSHFADAGAAQRAYVHAGPPVEQQRAGADTYERHVVDVQ